MRAVRPLVREAMERILVDSGIARARVRSPKVAIAILAYHNIVPHGEAPAGDRSLHLAQQAFADHLDCLATTHDIVHLDDLTKRPLGQAAHSLR